MQKVFPQTFRKSQIRKVNITKNDGNLVPLRNGSYFLKLDESVTIAVEIENPQKYDVKIVLQAVEGTIESNTYIPPRPSSGEDIINIRALNKNTGDTIYQEAIRIKIINNTP